MIKLNSKLKCLFENIPCPYVSDEEYDVEVRVDKLCYATFKRDEVIGLEDEDWEVIHLDGNWQNSAVDNLELVVFVDEDDSVKYEADIRQLKRELVDKNDYISKITIESKAKDGKIVNMNKQVAYEQNRVKELTKEIKSKEKEIRRLLEITGCVKK